MSCLFISYIYISSKKKEEIGKEAPLQQGGETFETFVIVTFKIVYCLWLIFFFLHFPEILRFYTDFSLLFSLASILEMMKSQCKDSQPITRPQDIFCRGSADIEFGRVQEIFLSLLTKDKSESRGEVSGVEL